MAAEPITAETRTVVDVETGATLVHEAALAVWRETPKEGQDAALAEALQDSEETMPGLLGAVLRHGVSLDRPAAEQRAFARQIGSLVRHSPEEGERLFGDLAKRVGPERKPGVMTAALESVAALRESDPDSFAHLLAIAMIIFRPDSAEWKKARSVLFDGSHSGYAAYNAIEPALRSDNEVIRRRTARHLLPELATKAQYGKEILDLIEDRFRAGDDRIVLSACIRVLPMVFERRPGQASRIMDTACAHEHPDVREAMERVRVENDL